jgi:hypothetical protein
MCVSRTRLLEMRLPPATGAGVRAVAVRRKVSRNRCPDGEHLPGEQGRHWAADGRQFESSPRNQRTRDSFFDKAYSRKALPSSSILLSVSKAWQPSASTAGPKPPRMDAYSIGSMLSLWLHAKRHRFSCRHGLSPVGLARARLARFHSGRMK